MFSFSSDVSCVAELLGLAVDDGLQDPYNNHRTVQHSKVKNIQVCSYLVRQFHKHWCHTAV